MTGFDPRLDGVDTREQFASALSAVREASDKTVEKLADEAEIAKSTIGGWFGGSNLPGPGSHEDFRRVLRLCGVEERLLASWVATAARILRRSRRSGRSAVAPTGVPERGPSADNAPGGDLLATGELAASRSVIGGLWRPAPASDVPALSSADLPLAWSAIVSVRPPFGRLDREPTLRDREPVLTEFTEAMSGPGGRAFVLHGLGGVGKSMVALTVARRAEELGHDVWWLDADSVEALLAGVHALAVELGATQEQLRGSSPDVVWRLLEARQRPWLLVFDNANRPDSTLASLGGQVTDGNGWLRAPRGLSCVVLVTTRDGTRATWGGHRPPRWLRLRRLQGLSASSGAQVLMELAGSGAGTLADAENLAELFGGLPLALRLAGGYLSGAVTMPATRGAIRSFLDFASAMREGGTVDPLFDPSVPGDATDQRARELVGRAWEPSFRLLAEQGVPYARPLLHLLSCFDRAPMPVATLARPRRLAESRLLPARLSVNAIWACVRALAEIGMVELFVSGKINVVRVHPLVRVASLSVDDFQVHATRYALLAADLLLQAVTNKDPRDPQSWQAWSQIADHARAPLALCAEQRLRPAAEQAEQMVKLGLDAAAFLRSTGQLGAAEASLVRIVHLGRAVLGEDEPGVLLARRDLARVRYVRGLLTGAETQLEDVLPLIQRRFGELHPETLTTMHYLGRVRHDLGRPAGEAMLRRALAGRERALGEDHRDTLASRCMVGECLRARGRPDEAAHELTTVLELLKRQRARLSGDHPLTLLVRAYLTRVRLDQRDYEAAHTLAAGVVADSTRVLGADHPRTLAAIDTQVAALHGRGNVTEALGLARRLNADRERTLGAEHPSTLQTRHQLGLLLADQGEYEEADQELRAAALGAQKALGPQHPLYAAIRESLNNLQIRRRSRSTSAQDRARRRRDGAR